MPRTVLSSADRTAAVRHHGDGCHCLPNCLGTACQLHRMPYRRAFQKCRVDVQRLDRHSTALLQSCSRAQLIGGPRTFSTSDFTCKRTSWPGRRVDTCTSSRHYGPWNQKRLFQRASSAILAYTPLGECTDARQGSSYGLGWGNRDLRDPLHLLDKVLR